MTLPMEAWAFEAAIWLLLVASIFGLACVTDVVLDLIQKLRMKEWH